MIRFCLTLAVAASVVVPAFAKVAAPQSPSIRALSAEVVIVGKVTAIEKEPIAMKPQPTADQTSEYRVALVKIEKSLLGAAGLTHVKVAFQPPKNTGRRGALGTNLEVGQEMVFFLSKHPVGGQYFFDYWSQPIAKGSDEAKGVELVARTLANPKAALEAKAAAERTHAAAILILRHRHTAGAKLSHEESQRILKALAATDWRKLEADVGIGYQAFNMIGLTEANGWKPVILKPGQDYLTLVQAAFRTWLEGPGKDYVISPTEGSK